MAPAGNKNKRLSSVNHTTKTIHHHHHHQGLDLVSSLHDSVKGKEKTFVVSCDNMWPNFIFILPRTLKKQSKVQLLT